MEKQNNNKMIKTTNIWIASFLKAKGYEPLLEKNPDYDNLINFCFPDTPEISLLLSQFPITSEPDPLFQIDVRTYIKALKELKDKVFMFKETIKKED